MNSTIPQIPDFITPGFDPSTTLIEAAEIDVSSATGYSSVKIKVSDFATGAVGTDIEEVFTVTGSSISLANSPSFVYGVFMNGVRLTVSVDYTIITTNIVLLNAALSDLFVVSYKY
jgi:hypothetical protein